MTSSLFSRARLMVQPLIRYFGRYLQLDEQECALLEARAVLRRVKRRNYILQEGDICKHYSFVLEGCLKMYGTDKKGIEHNVQFASENEWMSDIGSFHSEKPSRFYIEALEPSHIIQISKPHLIFLYENVPKIDRIFRIIIEEKFVELQNHVLKNISFNAQERYQAFLEQYPDLSLRLPNTQIASYLGITPEFLSKVRKDLVSH
jgi:CRP-like cAMP-binding protein